VSAAGRVAGESGILCKAGVHLRSDDWIPQSGCGLCNQERALDRAVDAVLAAEPPISAEIVRAAIVRASSTTRMRNEIAAHLLAHPGALRDGSSAAPAPLRRLIVELRGAGITGVTDPRCLDCGNAKPLIGRVEGGRVCDGCKRRRRIPQQCARCGKVSPREGGDTQGRALCGTCHSRSYIRPVHRCTVCGINRAYSTRRRVCIECAQRPHAACVTCGLAAAIPVPGTEARCAHCARLPPMPCAVCGEQTICKDRMGRARCEDCYQRPVGACGRCGRVRPIVRRAVGSDPDLCAICWTGPTVMCEGCGQVRPCRGERRRRMLCSACGPVADQTCAHCHRQKRPIAQWPEGPVCNRCYHRALAAKDRCPSCGETRRLLCYPGFPDLICSHCAGAAPDHVCGRCGAEDDLYQRGLCGRCVSNDRLTALLGNPEQRTRRGLAALFDSFVATSSSPKDMIRWLAKSPAAAVLGQIARGELACDYETLDRLPASPAVRHLEGLLVATGALPPRDPTLARLEHWIEEFLRVNDREPALRTFAHWIILRRYRRKSRQDPLNTGVLSRAKVELTSAGALIDWLADRGMTLASCRQAEIDTWLAGTRPDRYLARSFARWAIARGLMPKLEFPSSRRTAPTLPVIDHDRNELARRLLHDPGITTRDRVAGSLIVLFAQPLSRVARLAIQDITLDQDTVSIRLGTSPITVPEPLAGHLRTLVDDRSCRAAARLEEYHWLFPGNVAGRAIDEQVLSHRLKRIGVESAAARRAALLALAGEIPAALLADLIGIHIATATQWAQIAGRPWSHYPTLRNP
jgi:hypothetical protein